MSVHEDTLQGLQGALEYLRGDKTKGQSAMIEMPNQDISTKYNLLPDPDKQLINVMIEKLFVASGQ